jgi:16S rRNA (cytosine1402-N4)-methyltransferase
MHKPVLLNEVLEFAAGTKPKWILDGTFGRGGHTRALMEAYPAAQVVALDQDAAAVEFAKVEFSAAIAEKRLRIEHFNFHEIAQLKDIPAGGYDIILLDLGVSSPQLDTAERGFSFYHDGPLDMRMNQSQELSAAEVINTWSEVELNDLFIRYGEVRRPQRVTRAIVNDRKIKPYQTTRELASLMERVEGWRKKGSHPATRYFLALRMAVNNELAGLETSVTDLMRVLSPNGRLIIITFHSLEDRIIKYAFREARELGIPLTKRVVIPSDEETATNPRARSSKLRVFQRGGNSDESAAIE